MRFGILEFSFEHPVLMEIVCFCSQVVNSRETEVVVHGLPSMPQEALTEWQTV